jgi:predicted N-acetyltransferase YhbS
MSFTIRKAEISDSESIATVLHESFAEFNGVFDPPSGALSETGVSIARKLEESLGFVAELDGQLIGCVFCRPEPDDFYLFRLAVRPPYRGTGAGRGLVKSVEDEAARQGFSKVRLFTRLAVPKNVVYYEGLGYEKVAEAEHPITGRKALAVMVKSVK